MNERIRSLLRLEDLAARFDHLHLQREAMFHQLALGLMFEILDIAARADIKSDLLQELERQRQVMMSRLDSEHETAYERIDRQLGEIDQRFQALSRTSGKTGQHIRDNDWLMGLRTRMAMPGGACRFDVPSFHAWLHREPEERQANLTVWIAPFLPLLEAAALVMRLLRTSGLSSAHVASGGSFQQMLAGKAFMMASVEVDSIHQAIPEVAANKYAISVRFTMQDRGMRPRPHEGNIPFTLTLLNL